MAENQEINFIFSSEFTTLQELDKNYATLDAQEDGSIKTVLDGNQIIFKKTIS